MTNSGQDLGMKGEEAAANYLQRVGMDIVERNWATQRGEVDVIALDDEYLVFVEVKTRLNDSKGKPEDAVTVSKQERYGKLAMEYLASHEELAHRPVRFDVVGITAIAEDRAILRHHRNAFVCE